MIKACLLEEVYRGGFDPFHENYWSIFLCITSAHSLFIRDGIGEILRCVLFTQSRALIVFVVHPIAFLKLKDRSSNLKD